MMPVEVEANVVRDFVLKRHRELPEADRPVWRFRVLPYRAALTMAKDVDAARAANDFEAMFLATARPILASIPPMRIFGEDRVTTEAADILSVLSLADAAELFGAMNETLHATGDAAKN